jgi:hypothetical protein
VRLDTSVVARLQFLCRVVERESRYLQQTDARLFGELALAQTLKQLDIDPLLAERLDAFVSRFGRLQDTVTDKLLPALLQAMAEPRGAALENLDRAEKLGWLDSADQWLEMRKLRNQMVHEYIEDRVVLTDALQAGHAFVPMMLAVASRLIEKTQQRLSSH